MSEGHRVLIVEDNERIAQALAAYVRSLGHVPTVVSNLRDAVQALLEHDFCYAIVDVGLPSEPGEQALTSTGLRLIEEVLRRRFSHRNPTTGIHDFQIIVVSANEEPKFVSLTLEKGGDAFIDKPSFDDSTILTEKIRERLRLANREDHAACLALARTSSQHPPAAAGTVATAGVVLRIMGELVSGKTQVLVNEESVWLTPMLVRALLWLVVGRLRSPQGWISRSDLKGDADAVVKSLSRLRSKKDGLGIRIDEVDKTLGYRLFAFVEVAHVAAVELAKMKGEAVVAKLATEIERLQRARVSR